MNMLQKTIETFITDKINNLYFEYGKAKEKGFCLQIPSFA